MKTILLIAIGIVSLASCNKVPIIDGETPFIVNKIVEYNKIRGMSIYYGQEDAGVLDNFAKYPAIVLPSRKYNIGDTITLKDIKQCIL
jgi:hypothetical protein